MSDLIQESLAMSQLARDLVVGNAAFHNDWNVEEALHQLQDQRVLRLVLGCLQESETKAELFPTRSAGPGPRSILRARASLASEVVKH
jgi:hypothetical protein